MSEDARARTSLENWLGVARQASWKSFAQVRESAGSVDLVRVRSGNTVLVFNIAGNAFRLICSAHYDRGNLYTLRFLTHAEYSKARWKENL
ncbi:MAG: type II toxin-antitoxin system HigB family toxin [Verrucomicrobiae bacterium]